MDTLLTLSLVITNLLLIGLGIYFRNSILALIEIRKIKIIEEYKETIARRQRVEKVAELFARFHYKPDPFEISKLIWELSFYLPKELVCQLSETLVKGKSPADTMPLFISIREHLGIKDGLKWDNIVYITENIAQHEED